MAFLGATAIFSFFLLLRISADRKSSEENPLLIGVSSISFSPNFVQKYPGNNFGGFSIQVFQEVEMQLGYKIFYKFVEFNGSHDDLVASVANKTLDAAVGAITIMASRWDLVKFTVPYTESGLAMVVPVIDVGRWLFFKPFSTELWLATGGIVLYTMFSFWFIEHRSNPAFRGSWCHQIKKALLFTINPMNAAQSDTVENKYTRSIAVVWFVVAVIVIVPTFSTSLNSWITVKRLNPNMDLLKTKKAIVGCNPFMERFVRLQLGYKAENIKLMSHEGDYLNALKTGTISSALLEIPYAKLLVNGHCKEYAITGSNYRFGGLSFAFQKGSRIANDVSKAILRLSENGMLKKLEESWITPLSECSEPLPDQGAKSLPFESLSGIYVGYTIITTGILLYFICRLIKQYRENNNIRNNRTFWNYFINNSLQRTEVREARRIEVVEEI